jgi:hypothetical protein
MTRDDIIRMAREAGWQEDMFGIGIWDSQELNVFANLVAAVEREACAKVCEAIDAEYEHQDVLATWCAAAIRKRGAP